MGAFPTLQSPVIPLNKKLAPAFFSFLIVAFLDWSDWSIALFLGIAVVTNWVYQRDILNKVVDKMVEMMITAKNKIEDLVPHVDVNKITEAIEDKVGKNQS